jgi:hypothetical protein
MRPCRRRWIGFAVAVLLLRCTWTVNSFGDNAMTFTRLEYLISEMMGPPEFLVVEEDGTVRFESHTNVAEQGAQAVGTFAMTLTEEQMRSLAAAFANPPFRDLADHWGQIASGERYKAIREIGPSGQIEKRIAPARPVAPQTQLVIDRMDQIVKQVRLHPLRNLALRISDATLDTSGSLRATMTLTNPGTLPFLCIDPATRPKPSGARLSLSAWPDRDKSTLHSTDIVSAESIDVEAVNPSRTGPDDLLELLPNAAVSFRIRAVLPVHEKAAYVIQGRYQNMDSARAGLMVFEVYSRAERIK